MPNIKLALMSYEETVSEPIRKQILNMIDSDINYVNSAGNKITNSDGISLVNADESTVTINEVDYTQGGFSNGISHHNARYAVIQDKEIGLRVSIADVEKEFTVSISKRFATRGEAIWWRTSILGNVRDGTSNTTTDILVSPCVSNRLLKLIEECRLRKVKLGMVDNGFMPYLLDICAHNLSIDTNSIKSSVALLFPEKLQGVVLSLPVEIPQPSLEDGKYIMELDITTVIKVPTVSIVKYPTFIGGLLMPAEMLDLQDDVSDDPAHIAPGNPLDYLVTFMGATTSSYRDYCYQVPRFERYIFPFQRWDMSPIFQVRVAGNLNDPRKMANLNDFFESDIDGYVIDPSILVYFIENRENLTNLSEVAVGIVLLKDNMRITSNRIYVDENLHLRTEYDIDMYGDYHLAIVTHEQTASMPVPPFETLRDFPELINSLIKHTNPLVNWEDLPKSVVATKEIYRPIFDKIVNLPKITSAVTANTLVVETK